MFASIPSGNATVNNLYDNYPKYRISLANMVVLFVPEIWGFQEKLNIKVKTKSWKLFPGFCYQILESKKLFAYSAGI